MPLPSQESRPSPHDGATAMAPSNVPSHEFVDHTSELELRLRAPSFGDLIAEGGRALSRLLLRESVEAAPTERQITARGSDRAALLVTWLNELIYLAEADQWIPVEIEAGLVTDTEIRVRAQGVTVSKPPSLIKAATYHGLIVRDRPGGVEATVILDI